MTGTRPGLTSRIVESADAFEAIERGFPNYRYVLVEHPLSSARPEGIRQRAEQALPEVLSIVFGHAAGDRWPRMLPAEGGSRGHHLNTCFRWLGIQQFLRKATASTSPGQGTSLWVWLPLSAPLTCWSPDRGAR
jgi:hypothetical protein